MGFVLGSEEAKKMENESWTWWRRRLMEKMEGEGFMALIFSR